MPISSGFLDKINDSVTIFGANDDINPLDRSCVRWRDLRKTACHCNDGIWIHSYRTPHHLLGLSFPKMSDGTSVDYIYISLFGNISHNVAPLPEKPHHDLSLGLIHFTAKRDKCHSGHQIPPKSPHSYIMADNAASPAV